MNACWPHSRTFSVSLALLWLLFALPMAKAQMPIAAGKSAAFNASFGYAYARMNVPGTGHVQMSGLDASLTGDFLPRVGVRLDVAYLRSATVFGTDHRNDALTYLGGPVLYLARARRMLLYVDALFGGGRLGGTNLHKSGGYLTGFVHKPAWTFGAGAERRIWPSTSIRIGADYLHTSFFDQNGAVRGGYDFRGTVTFVYTFGRGYRR